jgi:hypothetical protein
MSGQAMNKGLYLYGVFDLTSFQKTTASGKYKHAPAINLIVLGRSLETWLVVGNDKLMPGTSIKTNATNDKIGAKAPT